MSHILIIKELQYTDNLEKLFSEEDKLITTSRKLEEGWKIWAKNLHSNTPVDIIIVERSRITEVVIKLAARIRRQSNIPIIIVAEIEPDAHSISELEKLNIDFVTSPLSADMVRKRAQKWIKKMCNLKGQSQEKILKCIPKKLKESKEKEELQEIAAESSNKESIEREQARAEQRYLESRGIKIDTEKNLAWDGERLLELRANEYKLLKYFIENKNQILIKQQILDKLEKKSKKPLDDNTVAVNIRRLRQKVEQNPSRPTKIKTIRGMGYLWFDDK